jgi:hypothetical protein
MRTLSTTAMIAVLVVLASLPVASAQNTQSVRTQNLSVLSETGGGATGGGTGGGDASGLGVVTPYEAGGFVGASAEDVRSAMTATGATREGTQSTARGQTRPGSSQFGRGAQSRRTGGGYGSRRSTSEIRARLRAGFSVVRPAPAQRSSNLASRLTNSSWLQPRSPMEVTIEGGKAVLRGVVATEHDRVLAERVAKLEPGVRQVENLLTLAPPSESPSTR